MEKGRARPTSAPVRPSKLSPNQQAMLQDWGVFTRWRVSFRRVKPWISCFQVIQERMKKMKEQEDDYKKQAMNT